jgi:hypothetical protein
MAHKTKGPGMVPRPHRWVQCHLYPRRINRLEYSHGSPF